MLLIKNGRVLNPATKTDAAMDVLLDGETIKEVAAPGKASGGGGAIGKMGWKFSTRAD